MLNTMTIDGHSIYNYFTSGAQKIIYNEKDLNSINVFPVADGDTGTNLALTMKMVISNSIKHKNISKALSSISEVATENAYGNSGMIFAEYLNGFASETKAKSEINFQEFIEIADKASQYAYRAVSSPKEGTILSVMRGWAKEMKNMLESSSLEEVFHHSINKSRLLVEKTKSQLKVLNDYNVVDAGAKAFLLFIEGIFDFIKKGEVENNFSAQEFKLENHKNFIVKNNEIINRYCSQFYIESETSQEVYKDKLEKLGDSLVITGTGKRYKIHVHTNHPNEVLSVISSESKILSQKIEDMKLANSIINNKKSNTAIVTDSIADIPQDILDKHQITVIPLNLICDSLVYLDKLTITPEEFYNKIDAYKMNPTSAQPSISVIEKTFSHLFNYYDSIVGIFVSGKMSGTYNNAVKAAKKVAAEGKNISIIDSKLNSAAQGLLVLEAARLAEQNLDIKIVEEKLNSLKKKIRIFVSVDDLSHMIKGGRIPKTLGVILNMVKLKPVVSIDQNGNGTVHKKTLSTKSALDKIISEMKNDFKNEGIKSYSLVYSDNKDDLKNLSAQINSFTHSDPEYVTPISPVVGLNAGKGSFAVAYVKGGD